MLYLDDLRSLKILPSLVHSRSRPCENVMLHKILLLHEHLDHPVILIQSHRLRSQFRCIMQFAAPVQTAYLGD
jgi:hypothetical protein